MIASAFDKKELPTLESGAMCYMMSKQQYLNDRGKSWHPHLMFYLPGKAAQNWGANMLDSPVLASYDSQVGERLFSWSELENGPMER